MQREREMTKMKIAKEWIGYQCTRMSKMKKQKTNCTNTIKTGQQPPPTLSLGAVEDDGEAGVGGEGEGEESVVVTGGAAAATGGAHPLEGKVQAVLTQCPPCGSGQACGGKGMKI